MSEVCWLVVKIKKFNCRRLHVHVQVAKQDDNRTAEAELRHR